jgi:hypothetical protein
MLRKKANKVFYKPSSDTMDPFNAGLRKIAEGWGGKFAPSPVQEAAVKKNLPNLDPAELKNRGLHDSIKLQEWCKKNNVKMPGSDGP